MKVASSIFFMSKKYCGEQWITKSEVLDYIKENRMEQLKFNPE